MTSVKIYIESKSPLDFSRQRLFLLESATLSGLGNLFLSHEEGDESTGKNKIKVLASGEDKRISMFYESLVKEYGIDSVRQPERYFGHVLPIDTYLRCAIAEEACLYAEAWKKCNEKLEAPGKKIQNSLK